MSNKKIWVGGIVVLFVIGFLYSNYRADKQKEQDSPAPQAELDSRSQAITDYLLSQKVFSWKTTEGSKNMCIFKNANPENELFPLSLWVFCAEYALKDGVVEETSGTSLPVKINYPNELSYFDISKFTHEIARDGTQNGADNLRIFGDDMKKLSLMDKRAIAEELRGKAEEWFRAQGLIK